jgi:hypothetical protein
MLIVHVSLFSLLFDEGATRQCFTQIFYGISSHARMAMMDNVCTSINANCEEKKSSQQRNEWLRKNRQTKRKQIHRISITSEPKLLPLAKSGG